MQHKTLQSKWIYSSSFSNNFMHIEYTMSQCESSGCTFNVNPNPANNDGKHCCRICKSKPGVHGPRCKKEVAAAAAAPAPAPAPAAAPAAAPAPQ